MQEHTVTTRPEINDGDVIEIDSPDGPVTALVLLVNAHTVILDLCDGSTPIALERAELRPYRVFNDDVLAAVA